MKKLKILKRIWDLCGPFKGPCKKVLAFLLVAHSIGSFGPVFVGWIMNGVTLHSKDMIVWALVSWFLFINFRVYVSYKREKFELNNFDYCFTNYLSNISMEKFFSISVGQHHLGHSAIKRSVMNKGESAVYNAVCMATWEIVPNMLAILLPTILLLVNVPLVGVYVLLAIVFHAVYSFKYNVKFMPRIRKTEKLGRENGKYQSEVIQNADVVFVNAQEERVTRECFDRKAGEAIVGVPMWTSYTGYFHAGTLAVNCLQGIGFSLTAYLAYLGKIDSGKFVTAIMWIGASLGNLWALSSLQRNLAKQFAPISKYLRFLDYEPNIKMVENPILLEKVRGRIEFRDVSFTYISRDEKDVFDEEDEDEEDEPEESLKPVTAIKNVSFVLEEGKCYAFVGKSGAGKSTIVGLILRYYDPQQGHVLIDGVDLRMLDYKEVRKNIGYVPQEVSLFDGTLRHNVTFGLNGHAKNLTENQMKDVAELSRVSEFWGQLEKGWDTLIGERGIKLSGGQRQRVGIARALIKDPPILIFDEATSSLDTENEAKIRESIKQASVGKTTIIIAHRLATVKHADKIFVCDSGGIVGEGTHDELVHTNEYYQRLVTNQVIMA